MVWCLAHELFCGVFRTVAEAQMCSERNLGDFHKSHKKLQYVLINFDFLTIR